MENSKSQKIENQNTKEKKQSKLLAIRILYIVGGFVSLVLGCIGIALPILPTVPFFLLTTFCFAKGSKRFHDWFLATKLYKKYMSGFAEYKAMSLSSELILMIFVSAMLIAACLMSKNVLAMAIVMPMLVASKYLYFILRVKTVSKDKMKEFKIQKEQNKVYD